MLTGISNSQISKCLREVSEDIRQELQSRHRDINSLEDIEILEIYELCTYIKMPKNGREYVLYSLLLNGKEAKLLILK